MDKALARLKSASDESLTRLKLALDAGQSANRELSGVATVYFHTLRSIALGEWDEAGAKSAESSMIHATYQLLHVDEGTRNQWFDFWQRAQDIYRMAAREDDAKARPEIVADLMAKKVSTGTDRIDLRECHLRLEHAVRAAIEASSSTETPTA